MKLDRLSKLGLLVPLCLGLSACEHSDVSEPTPGDVQSVTGTLELVAVGGRCWNIATEEGEGFELVDLPAEFQVDGLRVRARVRIPDNQVSTCMTAPIAEVLDIERVD